MARSTISRFKDYYDAEERAFVLRDGLPTIDWPRRRKHAADKIRERRASMREAGGSLQYFLDTANDKGRAAIYNWLREPADRVPPKPTKANIWEAMKNYAMGSRRLWSRMGENDTEYYSACGHDDYLGEQSRWAWLSAQACARDWCRLARIAS